ncbi:MAG: MOSC domain-containing protein [Aestuariivirgaceae bacterium]
MQDATITAIYRYPVKGLSPEPLDTVEVEAGHMLPFDRAYAIENGSRDFDPINPKYFPKATFLQLMTNEQLAALETRFDAGTQQLQILRGGKQVAAGNLSMPIGRQLIEQFLSAYMGSASRGAPHIVCADDHHFADVPDSFISLINLASVRDIERVIGQPVDPLRFRGNIYVDGWQPWQEREMVGSRLSINGTPMLTADAQIDRCAATNVDPETGIRDLHIPRTLSDVFGHDTCGLYLSAIADGGISVNAGVSVKPAQRSGLAGHDLGI